MLSKTLSRVEEDLLERAGMTKEMLASFDQALAHQRFTMIALILPVIGDPVERSVRIKEAAAFARVSVQTARSYLCKYVAFQDIRVLALVKKPSERALSPDHINMRWALNKYYYNQNKWPLTVAYRHRYRYTPLIFHSDEDSGC